MRSASILLVLTLFASLASAQTPDTLVASDGTSDFFGYGVDIAGDVVVVGAPVQNSLTGAAYVYRYDGSAWIEEAKLTASDAATQVQFGNKVAISGDVIVVGAPYESERAYRAGAVYVYRYNGSEWIEEQKLLPPEGAPASSQFGWDVDVEGDLVVGGALGDSEVAPFAGAAYVYRYDGGTWTHEAKLTASDGVENAQLGSAVALKGDLIVVGSQYQDDEAGAAYAYRYDASEWKEEAKITASDGKAPDHFGNDIDINEQQWVIIGAWVCQCTGDDLGSAYIFHFDGSEWSELAKLQASNGDPYDDFGHSVALDGTIAVVGARQLKKPGGVQAYGGVYLFRWEDGLWPEKDLIYTPLLDGANAEFGWNVAAQGKSFVVGSITAKPDGVNRTGAAFVYTHGLQSVAVETSGAPAEYRLDQNFPNPFNPVTTIRYKLPVASEVRLSVFDVLGHEVRVLENGVRPAGTYEVPLDATELASGVYVYRIVSGGRARSRTMVVMK